MMTESFIPRAVKLRHQSGERAFVIEGAAASIDATVARDAPFGILVWNMNLLYLPEGWRIESLPEGTVRYAVSQGEGPVVKGLESDAGKTVLVLVPATNDGQEAIARGTRYVYMRDLFLLVDDDAPISIARSDATHGTFVVETSAGSETAAAFEVIEEGAALALTCADMSAAKRVALDGGATDDAIKRAFESWVRAAGES